MSASEIKLDSDVRVAKVAMSELRNRMSYLASIKLAHQRSSERKNRSSARTGSAAILRDFRGGTSFSAQGRRLTRARAREQCEIAIARVD